MKTISGRAFVFGDDINTDVMAPGLYFKSPMAEMAKHCLEAVNPVFAKAVQPGDIVVAGRNFGIDDAHAQGEHDHLPCVVVERAEELGDQES